MSRSPATTKAGMSICGSRSLAVWRPAARSILRNMGKSTCVMCKRYGRMSSACTRSGSISPALRAKLKANRGGKRLQIARTRSGDFSTGSSSLGGCDRAAEAVEGARHVAERSADQDQPADALGALAVGLERDLASHRVAEQNAGWIAHVPRTAPRSSASARRCRSGRDRRAGALRPWPR